MVETRKMQNFKVEIDYSLVSQGGLGERVGAVEIRRGEDRAQGRVVACEAGFITFGAGNHPLQGVEESALPLFQVLTF